MLVVSGRSLIVAIRFGLRASDVLEPLVQRPIPAFREPSKLAEVDALLASNSLDRDALGLKALTLTCDTKAAVSSWREYALR